MIETADRGSFKNCDLQLGIKLRRRRRYNGMSYGISYITAKLQNYLRTN